MSDDRDIVQLSDIEHIRRFPGMYISSTEITESEEYVYEDGKIRFKNISYSRALLKIINEAIDNSVDEALKTDFRYGNRISVSLTDSIVTVKDNGRGIPVREADGVPMPVTAFCSVRAGSNFTDSGNHDTIGTHGIGIKAANIFSTDFRAVTCDGKKKLELHCRNHLSEKSWSTAPTTVHGTRVVFVPDLEDFHCSEGRIPATICSLVQQRLLFLSVSYPKIRFTFNNVEIPRLSMNRLIEKFSSSYEIVDTDRWIIAVVPNDTDQFRFFTYVDGVYMSRGGVHIDTISNDIAYRMRDLLSKKYPSIKPADIRNRICLIVLFRGFPDMKFDSQSKESLSNSVTEIREYLGREYDVDSISRTLLKNKSICDPVIELFRIKEEYKKRQELKSLASKKEDISSEKYFASIGEKKYLMITEGYSAFAGISPVLGRKNIAYYSLRGKPVNTMDSNVSVLIKNQEFRDLVQILNIDTIDRDTDVSFENVVCLSDSDIDGTHIASLLLVLFHNFAPRVIREGRLLRLVTPLVILFDRKKKIPERWFFSLEEYSEESRKNDFSIYEPRYYKGLGSFKGDELRYVIDAMGGMDSMLRPFVTSGYERDDECLRKWFSNKSTDLRKQGLEGIEFNLSSV